MKNLDEMKSKRGNKSENRRRKKSVLAVDIGNSNITVGVFEDGRIITSFRISSDVSKTDDEYAMVFMSVLRHFGVEPENVEGFCISSVVPPIQGTFESFISKFFPGVHVVSVGPGVRTGIPVIYNPPSDVGADRIANAVSAWEKYGKKFTPPKPIVVVDFGTAITFDCITKKGEYIGGAIFPGIQLAVESLFKKTAKLPNIQVKDTSSVIGHSTTESIQSGIIFGYSSMIDGMIEKIQEEFGEEVFSVGTGGYAELISKHTKYMKNIDATLTLDGLYYIYKMNVSSYRRPTSHHRSRSDETSHEHQRRKIK